MYKIAQNPEDYNNTYFAGIQVNATFYEGHTRHVNATAEDGNAVELEVYLTTHLCNLTASRVAYNVTIRSGIVTLAPSTEDKYLRKM